MFLCVAGFFYYPKPAKALEFPIQTTPAYVKTPDEPKPTKKVKQVGYDPCNCVSWARYRTGINVGSIGVAKNHPINSDKPSVGAIIVMHSKPVGHLGAVESFTDTTVTYSDCNNDYKCGCGKATISLEDKRIIGFYK